MDRLAGMTITMSGAAAGSLTSVEVPARRAQYRLGLNSSGVYESGMRDEEGVRVAWIDSRG